MHKARKLVFEAGPVFTGCGFGSRTDAACFVRLHTAMAGYQEVLSDPAYLGQTLCMTYPLIGNCGLADEDYESGGLRVGGVIVRDYNDTPSNHRYTKTLSEEMEDKGIAGISGVDTRAVARLLRTRDAVRAVITDADTPPEAVERLFSGMPAPATAAQASCKKLWYSRTPNYRHNVVAIDCGIKLSHVRRLNALGCNVVIVPYDTPAETILRLRPDGVFVSSGPGHPQDAAPAADTVRALYGRLPLFGVGLGALLLAFCLGGVIGSAPRGSLGGTLPVRTMRHQIKIVPAALSYGLDASSLHGTPFAVTYATVESGAPMGLRDEDASAAGILFYPESARTPADCDDLSDVFLADIRRHIEGRKANA